MKQRICRRVRVSQQEDDERLLVETLERLCRCVCKRRLLLVKKVRPGQRWRLGTCTGPLHELLDVAPRNSQFTPRVLELLRTWSRELWNGTSYPCL